MRKVVGALAHVMSYFDDILIYSAFVMWKIPSKHHAATTLWANHLRHSSIEFLGHVISKGYVRPMRPRQDKNLTTIQNKEGGSKHIREKRLRGYFLQCLCFLLSCDCREWRMGRTRHQQSCFFVRESSETERNEKKLSQALIEALVTVKNPMLMEVTLVLIKQIEWFWREESMIGVGGAYATYSGVFLAVAILTLESVWRESYSGVLHRRHRSRDADRQVTADELYFSSLIFRIT
ncbi:hypothetical protein PoB_002411400 [Plakobranchus ocellatus]|uniref:Uncharacterized protein n=1 Tax=Plakobranchus ocellatus TaxID=259542 RepID=A0AAV3ZT76_9GAST|nr:hypothetical protein PoB_002411400 [Plakobranchus ocellatus]